MAAPQAVVVGAGVGGVAAALALHRAGWSVQVVERRPAPGGQVAGAGISLWPNALRALAFLGVEEAISRAGVLGGRSGVRTPNGRWLARTDLGDAVQQRYGRPLIVTRRASLLAALTEALGADRISYDVTVPAAGSETGRPWIRTGDGTDHRGAELVVIADGARSKLRHAVLGTDRGVRHAGYTSWRFIAPRPRTRVDPAETWGPDGQRFAILPLDEAFVYCYATANSEGGDQAGQDRAARDERAELRHRFGSWHAPIPDLLDALEPDHVIRTDVTDMTDPPTILHSDRLVLLGDAAHVMTPDLGQGGCQALEDAVTLGAFTPAGCDVPLALARYSAARGRRGADLVRRSRRAGRLYQSPPWLARTIARASTLVPPRALLRPLAPVLDWQPPSRPDEPEASAGRPGADHTTRTSEKKQQ